MGVFSWRKLEIHPAFFALARTMEIVGKAMPVSTVMMPSTTNNSINVNPRRLNLMRT